MPVELEADMGSYWPHAVTAMAFLAGATTRINVTASVIVLPYHHPVNLAKALSTLDVLSGGRVIPAVGIGHAEREFDVLGVPFAERGPIADEYLAVINELWTATEPKFTGRYVSVEGVVFEPKPVQRPRPPIWVGGNSKASLRRAARYGDGWYPWLVTPEQLPAFLGYLHDQPEFASRSQPFDIVMPLASLEVGEDHRPLSRESGTGAPRVSSDAESTIAAIARLAELGVTWTSMPAPPLPSLEAYLDHLRWTGEQILPATRPL
jgi:probable F420-dependent oxidoreductase